LNRGTRRIFGNTSRPSNIIVELERKIHVRKPSRPRCKLLGTQVDAFRRGPGTALGRLEVTLARFSDRPGGNGTLEAWVLATLPRALAFAQSLLRDRTLAEDVTHDCYVRLLAKAETYDLTRDGTKILYKAITNACIDRNYRDRRMVSLEAEALGELSESPLADGRAADPLDLAAQHELAEAVALELESLTVAQRGALELKSLGYSLDEIAEALGTTVSNAGVLVHRARKILAGRLARFLEEAPDESAEADRRS
jgi:RNA polymerase sigma-70 factor, ECF subfamily